jgi:hypothetical protein
MGEAIAPLAPPGYATGAISSILPKSIILNITALYETYT